MADEEKIILTLEADDEASGKIDKITGSIRNLEREANGVGNGLSGGISGVGSYWPSCGTSSTP